MNQILRTPLSSALIALLLISAGCSSRGNLARDQSTEGLVRRDWVASHRASIERMMEEQGKSSPSYSAASKPVAVFDWDNTMILNDIGEGTFMHLADTMGFSFDDNFWKLIPSRYRSELRRRYAAAAALPADQRHADPDYQAYRKLLIQSYWHLCETKGDAVCYPWAAQIMTGLTVEQVRAAGRAAMEKELAAPVGKEKLALGADDRSPLTVNRGIRYYPQMVRLISELQDAGFEVWIVSASAQWVVEEAAAGAGLRNVKVLGMLPAVNESGALTPMMLRVTYRKGKADAIRSVIGKEPVFVAGDSMTDYEMMRMGSGPRLLIDRNKKELLDAASKHEWLVQPKFLDVKI